jgi:hypothetical protein
MGVTTKVILFSSIQSQVFVLNGFTSIIQIIHEIIENIESNKTEIFFLLFFIFLPKKQASGLSP